MSEKLVVYDHHIAKYNRNKDGDIESVVIDLPPVLIDLRKAHERELEEYRGHCIKKVSEAEVIQELYQTMSLCSGLPHALERFKVIANSYGINVKM